MGVRSSDRAMRPFWIHQIAEYVIGLVLVAQGIQDTEPLLPTVAGTLLVVNAASVRGPLGAFKLIGRRVHRWIDVLVAAAVAAGALQPWVSVSGAGRVTMLLILIPYGFLWFYTDWAEKPARWTRRADRGGAAGERAGRVAGRLAGSAYSTTKTAIKNRSKSS